MSEWGKLLAEFGTNLGLLISLTFVYGLVIRKLNHIPETSRSMIEGALFGTIAIVGMQIPLNIADGIIVDGRTVIVMLAGAFAGPMAGAVAGALVSAFRIYLGGIGTIAGVGAILSAMAIGIIFWMKYATPPSQIKAKNLLSLAIPMTVISFAWIFALPSVIDPLLILSKLSLPVGVMYPLTTLLLGLMLAQEHRRLRLVDRLRQSEARFRDFAASASDWFWETDPNGHIIWVSKSASGASGHSVEHVSGMTHEKIAGDLMIEEEWRPYWQALLTRSDIRNFEYRYIGRSGDVRYAVIDGKPLFDDRGEFIGYRGAASDTTERVHLEKQLRQSQRMDALGQLTGGIAHDFNNLLNIMLGNAELLELRSGKDQKALHNIDALKGAVARAASLTNRLLAFSKQQSLSPVPTDISVLVSGLTEMLHRALGEIVELHVVHTPDLWVADIDPHQFENALINLAINARDAMVDGGKLTIETANVTLEESYTEKCDDLTPGEYIAVSVSDTGTGISPSDLDKVFEPFFTTKGVGQGSGLGLSMVYGFAKQSGGHISIYSELGHGTTIKLYLPRSMDVVDQLEVGDDVSEAMRGSERILIVEDDQSLRDVPVSILRDQGYEVVEAGNGPDAIKLLEDDRHFDLLFTDVVLPGGINGVEIAKSAVKLQPNIKVLYTTGYAENSVVHHGRLEEGQILINKPYQRSQLLEKIQLLLRGRNKP
jgi:PAS domain S-box-containing protein